MKNKRFGGMKNSGWRYEKLRFGGIKKNGMEI